MDWHLYCSRDGRTAHRTCGRQRGYKTMQTVRKSLNTQLFRNKFGSNFCNFILLISLVTLYHFFNMVIFLMGRYGSICKVASCRAYIVKIKL